MSSVYIVSSCRTPIAKFNGSYASIPAAGLGSHCIRNALLRVQDSSLISDVDEVVLGQVYSGGVGQNAARQAAIQAGLPLTVSATTVNMVCGSGMRAILNGYQSIRAGDSNIVITGGQESMTQAPHFVRVRGGSFASFKTGNIQFEDSMVVDGLQDAFSGVPMGVTAEKVALTYGVSREKQDAFALASQTRATDAIANGYFTDEIVPVCVSELRDMSAANSNGKSGKAFHNGNGNLAHYENDDALVEVDECPRASTLDGLRRLRTAFDKSPTASVTAGNASGLADGAACIVLASEEEVSRRALRPLARIVSWSQSGVDPSMMGVGPVQAIRNALTKAGWSAADVDLFEINEAFAATTLAVLEQLDLNWSSEGVPSCADRVNVAGGAIALGHPLGATGARLVVTLVNQLRRTGKRRGLAALCVGGGLGLATCVEAV